MENPSSWGRAEHVVHDALNRAYEMAKQQVCGLSDVRMITDALREAGLLREDGDPETQSPR